MIINTKYIHTIAKRENIYTIHLIDPSQNIGYFLYGSGIYSVTNKTIEICSEKDTIDFPILEKWIKDTNFDFKN